MKDRNPIDLLSFISHRESPDTAIASDLIDTVYLLQDPKTGEEKLPSSPLEELSLRRVGWIDAASEKDAEVSALGPDA